MSAKHPSSGAVHQHGPTPTRPWPVQVGFWLLIGIAAFFLMTEHHAHLVAGVRWLPILLLLACPLIHVFSLGRHGGHGGNGANATRGRDATGNPPPTAASTGNSNDSKPNPPQSHGGDPP
ncbi:MAG: DUF2933 domain-containing protein [Lysobacter sp.]